jgi:hypothetical protein
MILFTNFSIYQYGKKRFCQNGKNIFFAKKIDKIKNFVKQEYISLEEMADLLGYESPNDYYLEKGRVNFPVDIVIVSEVLKYQSSRFLTKWKIKRCALGVSINELLKKGRDSAHAS